MLYPMNVKLVKFPVLSALKLQINAPRADKTILISTSLTSLAEKSVQLDSTSNLKRGIMFVSNAQKIAWNVT